ncbi:MAG: ribonuclease P protein component [Parcubacteria group bacterium]|nr:MAG: ribonuclease P protein component [Parcubacteria group bacterium]
MLPKIYRLHSDKEIKDLVRTGQTFFLPEFVIKYRKNREKNTKVAFVVSTKVEKRAVIRNKLARRLREVIQRYIKNMVPGYSVLIIAKKRALELDFMTIGRQILFALNKSRLYRDNNEKTTVKSK